MNYNKDELNINLKDMLLSVVCHWKKIIVIGVVLALVMAGLQGALYYMEYQEELEKTDGTAMMTQQQKFESSKFLLERRVAECELQIAKQSQYLRESVLMNIDPNESYLTTTNVYIDTDYQIMPDMTYQNENPVLKLLSYYEKLLFTEEVLTQLSGEIGLGREYLEELIRVNTESGIWLEVMVYHNDPAAAEQISNMLVEIIRAGHANAEKLLGEHSIEVPIQSTDIYLGTYVTRQQTAEAEELALLELALDEAEKALEGLSAPSSLLIRCIKWAILGGIAGGILAVVIFALLFVLSDEVHSAPELADRAGVKVFGKVANEIHKFDFLSRKFRALADIPQENTPDNYALIAEKINLCSGNEEPVLVVSVTDESLNHSVAASLQENGAGQKFVGCGNVLQSAAALRSLREHKQAVMIAHCGVLKYGDMLSTYETLRSANVELLGCIVME